jgi:hypothetical protein
MPDSPDHPIAYFALEPGTPVQTSEGRPFATVQAVLVDQKVSVFDGLTVQTSDGIRFVDADWIGTIYTTRVCTTLTEQQVTSLPLPEGSTLIDVRPGRSMADRLGRLFGRGKG